MSIIIFFVATVDVYFGVHVSYCQLCWFSLFTSALEFYDFPLSWWCQAYSCPTCISRKKSRLSRLAGDCCEWLKPEFLIVYCSWPIQYSFCKQVPSRLPPFPLLSSLHWFLWLCVSNCRRAVYMPQSSYLDFFSDWLQRAPSSCSGRQSVFVECIKVGFIFWPRFAQPSFSCWCWLKL